MVYTKQVWIDNSASNPISAARLSHLEDGVDSTDAGLETHLADITNPHATTKAQVGLSAVDNTSDATKNAAIVTLLNKTITSPVITNPTGIVKADVGLANVDNTSDITKNAASVTLTNKTITAPLGIVKADVGLANVDNTSDATKNAAAATLLNKTLTSPTITSPSGLVKADIGLGSVDNTSDATKNTAAVTLTNKTLTSPVINTPTGILKSDIGLANVDNVSDVNKPVSTATTTAIGVETTRATAAEGLKSPIASPTFTGTVTIPTGALITAPTGIVKADVGLGNIDNTSDVNKPVSTATATSISTKTAAAAALNPDAMFTGAITLNSSGAPTAASVIWPDGTTGAYTGTASGSFPFAVDSYAITYIGSTTKTYTQPAVTRNGSGFMTNRPSIVVT